MSGNYHVYKIEERVTFSLIHAHLYLAESDNERDDNSAAANTFDIYCGGGRYRSSLSAITVSLLVTSGVVCCWIFMSAQFLPNDPLSIDDMMNWDNYTMLGIGGEDTNFDEGSFILQNSW